MRARTIEHAGQLWVNLEDLRVALRDDQEAFLKAAAMLKVSRDRGDDAPACLRNALAYVLTELTGVLDTGRN